MKLNVALAASIAAFALMTGCAKKEAEATAPAADAAASLLTLPLRPLTPLLLPPPTPLPAADAAAAPAADAAAPAADAAAAPAEAPKQLIELD